MSSPRPRVRLRPLTDDDIAAVEPWYGEAAAAVAGLPPGDAPGIQNLHYRLEAARAGAEGGLLAIVEAGDRSPIGLLDYRANQPEAGWLTVGFIAVNRDRRGFGYGAEAVRLLEAQAQRQRKVSRFAAEVDMRNGLGLYFWLRLGYRPNDRPWPSARRGDIISMIRLDWPREATS